MTLSLLVVGGAGYVGSHSVKLLLERGHDVTVLDNLSRGHRDAAQSARFVRADLLDPASLEATFRGARYDAVLHFAAYCYVGESVEKPAAYYRNNVVGTLNLLDAMREAGVANLVFSSTCATYGDPVEVPMRESHPQHPINPYGASKLMVETILRDYGRAYGLNSVALRYFNAAGSDPEGRIGECHDPETHIIPLVLMEALRVRAGGDPGASRLVVHGDDYGTSDGTCIRDYVHVDDLATAHLRAAERMLEGSLSGAHAFNLGTGHGFSVLEVIESGRRVTGVPIRHRVGPRRPGDPPRLVADAALAKRELSWAPRYTEIEGIVATAWAWFSKDRSERRARASG
jgi:UDP-glucose-4-epimerase GalE